MQTENYRLQKKVFDTAKHVRRKPLMQFRNGIAERKKTTGSSQDEEKANPNRFHLYY